jgi:uncharacterized protein (TIGR03492 family)
MARPRCRLVAVRDGLTARGLRRHGVAATAPGNPMMDDFPNLPPPASLQSARRLLLLSGSRMPEALTNLDRLLRALAQFRGSGRLVVLCATGSRPTPAEMAPLLRRHGYGPEAVPAGSEAEAAWGQGERLLLVGPGRFPLWAGWGEVALATAGTATEQVVGLGVPALSLPGRGPQFKAGFARRQSRLLGGAVRCCPSEAQMAVALAQLLDDPALRQLWGRIGRCRMGAAGGSDRLAALIERRLLGGGQG